MIKSTEIALGNFIFPTLQKKQPRQLFRHNMLLIPPGSSQLFEQNFISKPVYSITIITSMREINENDIRLNL